MIGYCLGIRVNDVFQEKACEHRDNCPYYRNVNLGTALEHPNEYIELNTYNNKKCQYYNEQWIQHKDITCETSDMQTDGILSLLNAVLSK